MTRSGKASRGICAALVVVGVALWPNRSQAQSDSSLTLGGSVGVGLRGEGAVKECCGPFRSELDRSKSIWFGGNACQWVTSRLGLEAEATWARDETYKAYVQGIFGTAPIRGYRAVNRVRMFSVSGLLRARVTRSSQFELDVVTGLGWVREARTSHLESVIFKPGLETLATFTFDLEGTRHLMTAVVGAEVGAPAFGRDFEIFAAFQAQRYLGSRDAVRTDLELGRTIWRFGAGVRRTF